MRRGPMRTVALGGGMMARVSCRDASGLEGSPSPSSEWVGERVNGAVAVWEGTQGLVTCDQSQPPQTPLPNRDSRAMSCTATSSGPKPACAACARALSVLMAVTLPPLAVDRLWAVASRRRKKSMPMAGMAKTLDRVIPSPNNTDRCPITVSSSGRGGGEPMRAPFRSSATAFVYPASSIGKIAMTDLQGRGPDQEKRLDKILNRK